MKYHEQNYKYISVLEYAGQSPLNVVEIYRGVLDGSISHRIVKKKVEIKVIE